MTVTPQEQREADAAYGRFLRGEVVIGDYIASGEEWAFGRIRTPIGTVIGETEIGGRLHIPCWRVRQANGEEAAIAKESAFILGFGSPSLWNREGE